MGNRLAISVPSQILPVEHYLKYKDAPKLDFKNSEGPVVVKVFVNSDLGVELKKYKDVLHRQHSLLDDGAPNCLMYSFVDITESAGIMLRQHVDRSLHERISTRPFLSTLEKLWLAFQLLCALRQAHQAQVYHGDIKSENVMVTCWSWVQLTDFAPFKPCRLPDNDPSDFTYYFDISRRRTCYVAPERFVTIDIKAVRESEGSAGVSPIVVGSQAAAEGQEQGSPSSIGSRSVAAAPAAVYALPSVAHQAPAFTGAMDIFSAGCVLVELFTDGYVPFNLTQLLEYRKGKYSPQKFIDKIEDPHVQALVQSMLSRDPSLRKSAGNYLEEQRGFAFPEYFYSFLWPYCKQFTGHPRRAPDSNIRHFAENLHYILEHLGGDRYVKMDEEYCKTVGITPNAAVAGNKTTGPRGAFATYRLPERLLALASDESSTPSFLEVLPEEERCPGLVLIVPMIIAPFRSSVLAVSRLLGLQTMMRMVRFLPDAVILDRLLPAFLSGLEQPESGVRAFSVDCVTHCLTYVSSLPKQDANIFPDYILPFFVKLTVDPSVQVRQALAENISVITDTAQRFLDWSLEHDYYDSQHYDQELQVLHKALQQVVGQLIIDPSNVVKRAFMQHMNGHLWNCFGLARANELIMKHLITYLNDTQDPLLRMDFFKCLRNNAVIIGPYQGHIIMPLLFQGMVDCDEWVVMASVRALVAMIQEGIFTNDQLFDVLKFSVPLLIHPNTVISHSIVKLICTISKQIDVIDVLANVRPLVLPFLQPNTGYLDYTDELCILNALSAPVPRIYWRLLLSFKELQPVLNMLKGALLQNRQPFRRFIENSMPTGSMHDDKLLERLLLMGLDTDLAANIVALEQHLVRTHSRRRATHSTASQSSDNLGDDRAEIQLMKPGDNAAANIVYRYMLTDTTSLPTRVQENLLLGPVISISTAPASHAERAAVQAGVAGRMTTAVSTDTLTSSTALAVRPLPSAPSLTDVSIMMSDSHTNNEAAVSLRYRQYRKQVARMSRKSAMLGRTGAGGSSHWQPQGLLISHLHEHSGRVHRLCSLSNSSLFVSASHDGTVRLWDAARTDREHPINKSRGVYGRLGAPVRSLAICESQGSVAAGAANGNIHVFRLDKLSMVCDRPLDKNEDVYAVDMSFYDTGCGEHVVVYGTVTGAVVGWDLRQPGTAWRFDNKAKSGLITSLMVDRDSNFVGVATNKGLIRCWDLRFQIHFTEIKHENMNHIRRLVSNPCDPRTAFASMTGNNEVTLWELDTKFRRQTLWASPSQPLDYKEPSAKSINGLCACPADDRSDRVLVVTGGTDCCLRLWDINCPDNSHVLVHAAQDYPCYPETLYREMSAQPTGHKVVIEERRPIASRREISDEFFDPHRPAPGHRDIITDIVTVEHHQRLIVSSDAMGVIKIWK